MDEEIEHLLFNQTDDLLHVNDEVPTLVYVQAVITILCAFIGALSDAIIIYMIASNRRMQTKTNIILMNVAINDGLYLLTNIHFLSSLMELLHAPYFLRSLNCVISSTDAGFQLNVQVFLFILISNSIMKNKRIQHKWILISIYTVTVLDFITHFLMCGYTGYLVMYFMCFIMFLIVFGTLLFKEFNNCYKKWYKKDPLTPKTKFRINVTRIYVACWFLTFFIYLLAEVGLRPVFFTVAVHCFLSSMYILIYIISADKNFKICALNLLRCKGDTAYDVDATIRFADDSSEDNATTENNQVQINFNSNRPTNGVAQTDFTDISTIEVP